MNQRLQPARGGRPGRIHGHLHLLGTLGGVLLSILDLLTPAVASSKSTLAKPGAPYAGFARGVIAVLESGAFSMAPDKLAVRDMAVDSVKTALNQAFAIDVDVDGFTPDSIGKALGSLLEQLPNVLDLHFFDRNHESTYAKINAPELRSKIKSRLVGLGIGIQRIGRFRGQRSQRACHLPAHRSHGR